MNLPVKDDGVRPAGPKDRCFYCSEPKGSHKADCVCRIKTVVLEMTIQYVVEVPQSWDVEMIEFHRNSSSFCIGNDIQQIAEENDAVEGCCNVCQRALVTYLREATEEDHEHLGYDDLKNKPKETVN